MTEDELKVTTPPDSAVGAAGVTTALRHVLREMGPVRGAAGLLKLNQPDGVDCMSCAWPDPEAGERSHAEFCENGAKALASEATRKRVRPEFFAEHSIADLARRDDYWLNRQGRMTTPMLKEAGDTHYRPITWEQAFTRIATELRSLAHPDQAAFYTSGRTSNEAAFLYQLMVRGFGTNNLPDCSNMCHESSGEALGRTIGIGKPRSTDGAIRRVDLG
ncbi:molybdopterin-dependent oxidoreductase [Pseudactinotalea sp. Z1739]|uniref:molybdopterin-dependent oxidoreductase n=1 Tax=Pseudactinotalea sp. Z1739 TaxID=3413028 RepID=UPI003C7C29E9